MLKTSEIWDTLTDSSRIWLYVADRPLSNAEVDLLTARATAFAQQWAAHGQSLKADARVLHAQVLALAVDGTEGEASGCSIDSSVHFVKEMENALGVSFFNRMIFLYRDENGSIATGDFSKGVPTGVNSDTLVFDHLADTKADIGRAWKPAGNTWLRNFL